MAAHGAYTQLVMDGFGVDRHLLGLRLTGKEVRRCRAWHRSHRQYGIDPHALFADAAVQLSSTWGLSTSNITMSLNQCAARACRGG